MVMLIYKKGKFANDNRLYRFSWQTFLFVIFLFIFTVLFDFIAKQPDVYVFLRFNEIFHGENPSSVANWIWFVGYIGLIAGFGIACIAAIVASIYNPKVDVERMNALTKQYIDEFIRNPNPQQPTTPIVP
jgi:cell division protein FtsW (lipid II flippase)